MSSQLIGLLLPLLFALHNLEEYRSFEEFKKFYFQMTPTKFHHRKVFLYALIILNFLAGGLCIANYFVDKPSIRFATTMVALALLVNGLQHCTSSLRMRKRLPGLISSIFLLIPGTVTYLALLHKEFPFSFADSLQWSLLAILIMLLAIRISLWLAYLLWISLRDR